MREGIGKYRGNRLDNGEWEYGSLVVHSDGRCAIVMAGEGMRIIDANEVDPETVGEFTGLQDENGVDIYDGDIIEFSGNARIGEPNWIKVQEWDDSHGRFTVTATVQLNGGKPYIDGKRIGNIHDNPELLEQA